MVGYLLIESRCKTKRPWLTKELKMYSKYVRSYVGNLLKWSTYGSYLKGVPIARRHWYWHTYLPEHFVRMTFFLLFTSQLLHWSMIP
jgi:hypothetical protein